MSGVPAPSARRRELCERIVWAASKIREYESGSVSATMAAADYARQIERDVAELAELLADRLDAIASVPHV
jgi:hypothetical protein